MKMVVGRLSLSHQLLCLVGFYLLLLAATVALAALGMPVGGLIALTAVGAGVTLVGGLRLARTLNRLLNHGTVQRLADGLREMQMTATHLAAVQTDLAADELSGQARQVAAMANDLLALTGREAKMPAGAKWRSAGGTDDISDFWELSNPH
jgi:hypothetical protein